MVALPIIATILAFLTPIVIIGIILLYFHKKRKATNELLMKALEAGIPLPKEYLKKEEEVAETIDKNLLARGIKLTGIGIGITGLLWGLVDRDIAWAGFVIICIGISQIITYFSCRSTKQCDASTAPVNQAKEEQTTTKEEPKAETIQTIIDNIKTNNFITDVEVIEEEKPTTNS